MSDYRARRLYRILKPSSPLFVVSGVDQWTDSQIHSISITRGGDAEGLTPSTATVVLANELAPAADQTLSVKLTGAGAEKIADLTGKMLDDLRPRWFGRIASQKVTDAGDSKRRETTVTGSQWIAQLALIDHLPVLFAVGMTQDRLASEMMRGARIPDTNLIHHGRPSGDAWDTVAVGTDDTGHASYRDVLTTYTTAIGAYWRTTRSGNCELWHIAARADMANSWRTYRPLPLHRSQCLAPVEWHQPVVAPASVSYKYRTSSGGIVTSGYTVYTSTRDRPIRTEPLDFTKLTNLTNAAQTVALARANANAGLGYRVETVTIDVLELLASDRAGDRQQAGQLLTLEHGDPIVLSYDWPLGVAGCYFTEQITETITPDEWTLTLSLSPYRSVVGGIGPANIAGSTWDTRWSPGATWDNQTPVTNWEAL